ncbi:MAG: hypothetical protein LBG98_01895 [Puniceicoccales bacterium]|jgi:adenosylmethionine-8-amino-7-oxononanoate aminotransferase|nr:hypothetical protein [Puniceicoccales bacterium]
MKERTAPAAVKIVRGEGICLFSESGEKYLDMIFSWLVNVHGHGNREIAEAIKRRCISVVTTFDAGFEDGANFVINKALESVIPYVHWEKRSIFFRLIA